jgi:hypothetical protein
VKVTQVLPAWLWWAVFVLELVLPFWIAYTGGSMLIPLGAANWSAAATMWMVRRFAISRGVW